MKQGKYVRLILNYRSIKCEYKKIAAFLFLKSESKNQIEVNTIYKFLLFESSSMNCTSDVENVPFYVLMASFSLRWNQ